MIRAEGTGGERAGRCVFSYIHGSARGTSEQRSHNCCAVPSLNVDTNFFVSSITSILEPDSGGCGTTSLMRTSLECPSWLLNFGGLSAATTSPSPFLWGRRPFSGSGRRRALGGASNFRTPSRFETAIADEGVRSRQGTSKLELLAFHWLGRIPAATLTTRISSSRFEKARHRQVIESCKSL